MVCESRITFEETPVFAAAATALIDSRLDRLGEANRAAFWSSIRKCYNTPYNDPVRKKAKPPVAIERSAAEGLTIPLPAMVAAGALPGIHAA